MNAAGLAQQRCYAHAQREAVSRCPQCKRFYCRECVTEHDGRLLCVQCLSANASRAVARTGTRWLLWALAAAVGLLFSYACFYTLGYVVDKLPAAWMRGADEE